MPLILSVEFVSIAAVFSFTVISKNIDLESISPQVLRFPIKSSPTALRIYRLAYASFRAGSRGSPATKASVSLIQHPKVLKPSCVAGGSSVGQGLLRQIMLRNGSSTCAQRARSVSVGPAGSVSFSQALPARASVKKRAHRVIRGYGIWGRMQGDSESRNLNVEAAVGEVEGFGGVVLVNDMDVERAVDYLWCNGSFNTVHFCSIQVI